MADSDGSAMAGMPGMAQRAARLSLPTKSDAGPISWPVSMADMEPGMQMATGSCLFRPTPQQQRAAVSLVNRTAADVARYRSLSAAKADGFVPVTPTGLPVVHYVNPADYRRGPALDPSRVPSLVYVNTAHGAVLAAAMYLVPPSSAKSSPPQPGGCLTQWHVHTNLCFRRGMVVGIDLAGCPTGSVNRPTPPMMHVWLAPVPGGPLAVDPDVTAQVTAADRLPRLADPNGTA
jgi:hypothetical protein